MLIIYDLIFLLFALIYAPVYILKGKFHRGLLMRLGILPRGKVFNRPIWIHAVSVGEAMAVKRLAEELRKIRPPKSLVISTVTSTGNRIARNIAGPDDFITYLPLDLSFAVRRTMKKINPSLFVIAETEIWPNLITCLAQKGIPVIIVNGRISDRSFKGYLCVKFLLRPVLNKIDMFCVQTGRDAQRFMRLGVPERKLCVTGNVKFDAACNAETQDDYLGLGKRLGLESQEKLLVAGSTHPQEEVIILGAYKKLLERFPALRLLIAPRHPERAQEIEKSVLENGFRPLRVSQLNAHAAQRADGETVFILDTIGELVSFYGIADIVFVGGSLIKKGGHNILEPASLGKPVLFGPNMANFHDIAELFLKNQAALQVRNQEELSDKIEYLLCSPDKAAQMSQRAKALILRNQGATQRSLVHIKNILEAYHRKKG